MTTPSPEEVVANGKPENEENRSPLFLITIDNFEILKHIGSGAYGEVAAARKKGGVDDGVVYAVKAMDKRRMSRHVDMVEHEFKILTSIRNPFFMRMAYSFQTNRHLVFVMPLAGGGDMLTRMERGVLTEEEAKFYICELVEAVGYLHKIEILHRDIKLENLLIANDGHLLITDYGLSASGCKGEDAVEGLIGTRHTMAPEVLLGKKYGNASDWWAFGITYCDMRSDAPVFDGRNSREYSENVVRRRPRLPKILSPRERGFINKLIVRDPAQRLGNGATGTSDVKEHDFFKGVDWTDVLGKKLTPPFVPNSEQIETFAFFPENDFKNKFPTFEQNVAVPWEGDIDFVSADLI